MIQPIKKKISGLPELHRRVITAIFGVGAILLLILYGGRMGMGLIVTVLSLAMIYEFSGMVFHLKDGAQKRMLLLSMAWVNLLALLFGGDGAVEWGMLIASFLILGVYFLFSSARFSEGAELSVHFFELCSSFFGLVYIVGLTGFLVRLHSLAQGPQWVLMFLIIVWGADTGAYFAGLKLGKHKLFPKVSPKKTVEGAIGGLLAAVFGALVFRSLFFGEVEIYAVILMTVAVTSFSILGDLLESLLKRAYEKKDSGSLLPGHGGFLDRFDAVVFSAPVMYACVRLFAAG